MLMASVRVEMLNTAAEQGGTTVEQEEVLSSGLAEAQAAVMVTLPQVVVAEEAAHGGVIPLVAVEPLEALMVVLATTTLSEEMAEAEVLVAAGQLTEEMEEQEVFLAVVVVLAVVLTIQRLRLAQAVQEAEVK